MDILEIFKMNFVINGVNNFRDAFFSKIWHIFVSEILTLGEMNLQVLWDSGDELAEITLNKNLEVFLCQIISKTGKQDSGFFGLKFTIFKIRHSVISLSSIISGYLISENKAYRNFCSLVFFSV